MNNRNIPPRIAARMAEITDTALAERIALPLSPYVIAVAEDGGLVVDLLTGEISRDDARVWPLAVGVADEQ